MCQRFAQRWSSKLGTPTKELTRGRQDLQGNLYDRLPDLSHPNSRVFSLINFQPQALSTDVPLLRPVDHSDNCSCSNQQRTTAQAKIVVTKKGKEKNWLNMTWINAHAWWFWKLLLLLLRVVFAVRPVCVNKVNAKAIQAVNKFSLMSCSQVVAKDRSQQESKTCFQKDTKSERTRDSRPKDKCVSKRRSTFDAR